MATCGNGARTGTKNIQLELLKTHSPLKMVRFAYAEEVLGTTMPKTAALPGAPSMGIRAATATAGFVSCWAEILIADYVLLISFRFVLTCAEQGQVAISHHANVCI